MYVLYTLLELDFKVIYHLMSSRTSVTLNIKKLQFSRFLNPILLTFSIFSTSQNPAKSIFYRKYGLSTLLVLDFKVIYQLVKFQGFSDIKYGKTAIFMDSDLHFAHFQPLLYLLRPFQRLVNIKYTAVAEESVMGLLGRL